MADAQTFTKPAEIAGIQEANTAVLPSGMPLNELLLRSSQIKWAHDEAAKQREEKQMADNMAMFDFNTVGVWDKDLAAINKLKDDGIKKFGDVNFLKRYNAGDLNALSEYQQWKTGLQSSIDLSKRRMVYDGANRELMNKDKKYQNETNIQNAKKFGDTPLSGDFYSMGVTPSANPYDVVAYSTKLAPDITETKEVSNGDGTFTKKTVSSVPLTGNKSLESAAQDILKDTEQIQNINQLLIDAKTTHDPNDDYITYDFTQVDKNGNPIPIHKKVADLTQQDIVNGLLVEERYRPQTDQTLEGSVYHPPQGDGATKTKYPYYSSGAVTTKIPSKDGQVEMVDSKTEYEKYTKDQKGLDGKDYKAGDIVRDKNGVSVHKKVEKEVPSKVGMYNGNLYSSPNEQPKNVPIDPPSQVYDIESEKWLDKNTIGTGVWTVSLVKDGTIYRKQNTTGGYNWLGYNPNNPTPDTKGYTPMDMVQVTKEDGKTYLIPKNGDIAEYISKLKREEGGGSTTTTAPTNTGTKGGGAFDDLGVAPQKKNQVINTPSQNQQVVPQKQVTTPTQNTTQPTVTPPINQTNQQAPTTTAPTKTIPINSGTSNWGKQDNQSKSEVKTFPTDRGGFNGGHDETLNGKTEYKKGEDVDFNGKKYEVKNFFEDGKPSVNRIEKYDSNGKLIEAKNESTNSTYKYSYFETEDGTKYYHQRGACGAEFCFHSYWGTEKPDKPSVGNFDKEYMYAYKGNDATMTKPNDLKAINSTKKIYQSGDKYYKTVDTEQGDVYVEQIKNNDGTFTDKKHDYKSKQ